MKRSIILFITLLIGFTVAKSQEISNGTYECSLTIEGKTSFLSLVEESGEGDEGRYTRTEILMKEKSQQFKQSWSFESKGGGYFVIKTSSGLCLGGDQPGLFVSKFENQPYQLWKWVSTGDGYYILTSKAYSDDKDYFCVLADGGRLYMSLLSYLKDDKVSEQTWKWKMVKKGGSSTSQEKAIIKVPNLEGKVYQLVSADPNATKKCLTADASGFGKAGTKVSIQPFQSTSNQTWKFQNVSGDVYRILCAASKINGIAYLNADTKTYNTNGGKIQLWYNNKDKPNMLWEVTKTSRGTYRFNCMDPKASNRCVDASIKMKGVVHMWTPHTGLNQEWKLVEVSTSSIKQITAGGSGTTTSGGSSVTILKTGGKITLGQEITCGCKSAVSLKMQKDGNLALYKGGKYIWDAKCAGRGSYCTLRADGNFVVCDKANKVVWESKTSAKYDQKYGSAAWKATSCKVTETGTFILVSSTGKTVYTCPGSGSSTSTGGSTKTYTRPFAKMTTGKRLEIGQEMVSQNGKVVCRMQYDGNFAIYRSGKYVWDAKCAGRGSYCTLRADGNFVVCDKANKVVWSSKTSATENKFFASSEWKATSCEVSNSGRCVLKSAKSKVSYTCPPASYSAAKSTGPFVLEYMTGAGQSYGGGGMPYPMVFKIKEKSTGGYVTDIRSKGLTFEVTANKEGKYDGTFNNLNDYCKNGDKACYGGYYYVPSNSGKSPYTLKVTVTLKKDGQVTDTYIVEQDIKK